jgi:HEAT repeat protein
VLSDFAAYYRALIEKQPTSRLLAGALAGVGETGSVADIPWIATFLQHERAAVRRAATQALASLDFENQLQLIIDMLSDRASSVSRMARDVLRRHAAAVGPRRLQTVLRSGPHAHSRYNAAALSTSLSKWDSVLILIEAASDADERIRSAATRWLAGWLLRHNQSFPQPTREQLREVREAMETHHLALDPSFSLELRSILRFWAA